MQYDTLKMNQRLQKVVVLGIFYTSFKIHVHFYNIIYIKNVNINKKGILIILNKFWYMKYDWSDKYKVIYII